MATAFRAASSGYRADLQKHERRLLSSLCGDVTELLTRRGREASRDSGDGTEDSGRPSRGSGGEADALFAHFSAELAGLDSEEPLPLPSDPVVRRLLPDASEDPEEADQLRRLTESSLRESQLADLRGARMMLETSPVTIPESGAAAFGRALNTVRLTLATRLEIDSDEAAAQVHRRAGTGRVGDSEQFMAEIYTFITWLQESLFEAMLEYVPEHGTEEEGSDT
ncbi:DUF2017 domain-containing protein [Nesterenkonia marinintestina]|uniref:DUF2017 domain-containing protein n=1 Tax=Nesterenkonia marinintestina TaxID=2979865 RepID=UPI0021C158B7|nr:DUF2017 domain-containing protein [Nesterenkonia sp. GX14115]